MGVGLQPSSSEPASSVSPLLLLEIEELPGGTGEKRGNSTYRIFYSSSPPVGPPASPEPQPWLPPVLPNFQTGQAAFECRSCPILALPGEAGCAHPEILCWFCCKGGGEPGGFPEPPALLL